MVLGCLRYVSIYAVLAGSLQTSEVERGHTFSTKRKREGKDRTFPHLTDYPDFSSVSFDDCLTYCQPHAGSVGRIALILSAIELIED